MSTIPVKFLAACVSLLLVTFAQADQTLGRDPFPAEKPPGFFHRASKSIGGFFHRVFGTEEESQPAPAPSAPRTRGPRYFLDEPPPEARTASEKNRHSDDTASRAASNTARSNNNITSPRNSVPVEAPSKPKTKKQDLSDTGSSLARNTSPKTKERPQSERPPASASEGPTVLYSNNTPKNSEPQLQAKTETASAPPPQKSSGDSPSVLTGSKTSKAGRVKSPYAPYSELDVTGLPSGSLALDPTTQKVFRVP